MEPMKIVVGAAVAALLGMDMAQGQTYTNAFPGTTFKRPVWFGEVPGMPETYLVLEQWIKDQGPIDTGRINIVRRQGDAWSKETLWSVPVNYSDEMGLLGFAFHPDFATNRKYYVNYNPPAASGAMATVIEERTMEASALKDAGTRKEILRFSQPYVNHNGGTLGFGPVDKYLYIGNGDGGSSNDPQGRAQNLDSLLGKMLRIDVNIPAGGKSYGIPADNPFATGGGRPEIFAWGLRNPWKWSFDPVTGKLWVGDVGQSAQEEVDIVVLGGNYGWKNAEGYLRNGPGIRPPVFAYERNSNGGTCITGGYVFRGSQNSKYYGKYIVADFNSKNVWALTYNGDTARATAEVLADLPSTPSSFGTDSKGQLYALGLGNGVIYRFDGPDWQPSTATSQPGHLSRSIGCIFSCKPGARLDAKAFGKSASLEIHDLTGARVGRLDRDAAMPGLKAGLYILRSGAGEAPNLVMIQ